MAVYRIFLKNVRTSCQDIVKASFTSEIQNMRTPWVPWSPSYCNKSPLLLVISRFEAYLCKPVSCTYWALLWRGWSYCYHAVKNNTITQKARTDQGQIHLVRSRFIWILCRDKYIRECRGRSSYSQARLSSPLLGMHASACPQSTWSEKRRALGARERAKERQ